MTQTALPEDPFDNVGGSRYLRLTNDCPKNGVIIQVHSVEKQHNDKFDKDEYHWFVTQYMPAPVEKTMTESSPGFCSALKAALNGDYKGKVAQIKWTHTSISRGRTQKDWSIKQLVEADISRIFSEG